MRLKEMIGDAPPLACTFTSGELTYRVVMLQRVCQFLVDELAKGKKVDGLLWEAKTDGNHFMWNPNYKGDTTEEPTAEKEYRESLDAQREVKSDFSKEAQAFMDKTMSTYSLLEIVGKLRIENNRLEEQIKIEKTKNQALQNNLKSMEFESAFLRETHKKKIETFEAHINAFQCAINNIMK